MLRDPLQSQQIYAKTDGLLILEYPVTSTHIQNRGEPIEWYTPVFYDVKPEIPAFHYAREIPTVIGNHVQVSYAIEPHGLADILRQLSPPDAMGLATAPVNIANVDPVAIARIKELAVVWVQEKLDAFARTRGYDSLLSVASYVGSSVLQFSTEGQVAIQLRDQVWSALYTYFDDVLVDLQPFPRTVSEIEASLPPFVWA